MNRLFISSIVMGFFYLSLMPNVDSIVNPVILLCLALFTCLFSIGSLASGLEKRWLSNLGKIFVLVAIPLSVGFSDFMYNKFSEEELIDSTNRFTLMAMGITILSVMFLEKKEI